jgi:pilus assembly protein CpaF
MFTIVISEKGGAERRETFDKNEINIGRVQGNDLMLPKGNVSKHHARLLYRDGRFIVTDLKSTNGTYVNGRKISQATIVREGDKIYVGDFVLRLETGQKAAAGAEDGPPGQGGGAPLPPARGPREGGLPVAVQPPPRLPLPPPLPPQDGGVGGSGVAAAAPAAVSSARLSDPDGMGQYALERDPDDGESSPEMRDAGGSRGQAVPRMSDETEPRPRGHILLGIDRSGARAGRGHGAGEASPQQAAYRLALVTLVDRVADVVDLSTLEQSPVVVDEVSNSIERAVRQQAKAMREAGEAPEGINLDQLAPEALRELVGLGPVGPLLEDDETTEIHVIRHDHVLSSKHGRSTRVEPAFTSEQSLARVIARLAHQSGDVLRPGELYIDRLLHRGAHLIAVAPGAAGGWVLHIQKRRRVEASLADLVGSGAISEAIAALLTVASTMRANVLVAGSGSGAVSSMLAAIAAAAPAGERVAVLQRGADEIALPQAHVIPLALANDWHRGEESVYAAARLGMDRIIVTSLAGTVAAATIDVIADGSEGVLAGVGAPSLRHGLARLVSQVALSRVGSSIEAAREAVGESFDIAIEVGRTKGGRLRAVRVSQLEGSDDDGVVVRDLFVRSANGVPGAGGSSDGTYVSTGVSPRLMRDFESPSAKPDSPPPAKRSGK